MSYILIKNMKDKIKSVNQNGVNFCVCVFVVCMCVKNVLFSSYNQHYNYGLNIKDYFHGLTHRISNSYHLPIIIFDKSEYLCYLLQKYIDQININL